jgi:hypothetical protein
MRAAVTVFVALALAGAAPAFAADAQSHVAAAKHAERRGEWHKALTEWKAAYSSDVNAEYLIGIGDSYSHLGNKAEARKNYEAYLADPLALPGNMDRVKGKLAALDAPAGGALALPGTGAGPGLALPGSDTPPPLGLPDPGAAPEASNKRNKRKKGGGDTLALPGPGLTLPGSTPPASDPGLTLPGPGLTLPGTEQAPSKPPQKFASNDPNTLVLPGSTPPPPPIARPTTPPPSQPPPKQTTVAIAPQPPPKQISTNPPPPRVPNDALSNNQRPLPEAQSGGGSKTAAWVVAGVAVVALGGGAFMYTKSSSAHSDLTGSPHSSADAASLLSTEKTDKTLSFVGVAAGLVAGGVAAALFAF